MTLMDIVSDPHLCSQMITLMRDRGVLDEHELIHIGSLHNSDVLAMNELLDWTTLEFMDDKVLAEDYGLMRLPANHDDHELSSPWLEQHIAATRRP